MCLESMCLGLSDISGFKCMLLACSITAQLVCVYLYKKLTTGFAIDTIFFKEKWEQNLTFILEILYFCLSFTACECYFTHFEPSQLLGAVK